MTEKIRVVGPVLMALLAVLGSLIALLYDSVVFDWDAQKHDIATNQVVNGEPPTASAIPKVTLTFPDVSQNRVELAVQKARALRPYLPPGEEIGYVSGNERWSYEWMDRYFSVRYGLAPALTDEWPYYRKIVADFKDEAALRAWAQQSNYKIIAETGDGMGLAVWDESKAKGEKSGTQDKTETMPINGKNP